MDEVEGGLASGTPKLGWFDLPAWLRDEIETLLGLRVELAEIRRGGFSPSASLLVHLDGGRRAFVKAAAEGANVDTVMMHREEARILPGLAGRPEVPEVVGWIDRDGWVALVLEAIDGRHPAIPWRDDELALVLTGLDGMLAGLAPPPVEAPTVEERLVGSFGGWQRFLESGTDPGHAWAAEHIDGLAALESRWVEASRGGTLLHADLRADQILLVGDRIAVVDWAHACVGAPWVDVAFMAPSVAMQGGPPAGEVLARSGLADDVPDEDVAAVVAAVSGYFAWYAQQPPVPGLPTLRAFQRSQSDHAMAWLRTLSDGGTISFFG